jgi:hypothetical protein
LVLLHPKIFNKQTLENTEGAIKKGQSGNIWYTKQAKTNKNTTQYVMDTTMRKQRQITYIRHAPLSNNWG